MQNADLGRVAQRLINDAVAFGQTNKRGELLFAGISIQIKVQSNLFESDRNVFGNAECSAKIEIAFCSNRGVAQWNAESGGDGPQCHACASYERFEQHVGRARAES